MRALIFHGYLLRGTGSNVYNANLAQALVRLGWDVHLLCQERAADALDWVHAIGRWRDGELEVEQLREPDGEGQLTVYNPEIAGLLPVYVHDRYPGFEVKTFAELSDAELDRYIAANVGAVEDVAAGAGPVDAALANHLVMGPLILSRAGLRFAAKIHGSALEYTVKPNPRFLPHAEEGMAAAAGVLVGSRHTAESLWETLPDLDLEAKTRLGPPGVDTHEFAPREPAQAVAAVERLAEQIGGRGRGGGLGPRQRGRRRGPARFRRRRGPARRLRRQADRLQGGRPAARGLAARPRRQPRRPPAADRLRRVRAGPAASARRPWIRAIRPAALEVARLGRALEGGPESPLGILESFLSDPPPGYLDAARAAAGSVRLAGRLEHAEVAELLPAADALVMPSTFPESFGMVAVEAAACGVLPISAAHSGMLEASRQLAAALPAGRRAADLLSDRRRGGRRACRPASGLAGDRPRAAARDRRDRSPGGSTSCGAGRGSRGAWSPPRRAASKSSRGPDPEPRATSNEQLVTRVT